MNYKYTNSTLAILLQITMTAVLWGCSKEELTADIAPGQYELSLTVTDGGYTSGDTPGSQTRAADDGYKTTFTKDDQIGLYAVDRNGSLIIKNVPLTLDETNGELKWKTTGDGKLTVGNAERIFVYYPYSSPPTVNASAATADEFFSDMISTWSPSRWQENDGTSYDLMVGMGTPGTPENGVCPLTVRLAHKMALIVISLPKTKYALSSDPTYTWIANDANLTPDNYASFRYMKDGTYRYLVKPGVETRLGGTFVNSDDETRKFALTATLPEGGCKTFTIDGAATTEKIYTMQIGDYYLKDGSLVSKDKTLSNRLKEACIGVVVKAEKAENDDCAYMLKGTSTPMPTLHGYVLALKDANYGSTCSWGYGLVATNNVGTDTAPDRFSGYKNTQTIISYVNNNDKLTLNKNANATYRATEDYEDRYAAPANTSGWFLPSAGQCKWWFDHGEELLSGIEKAGGDKWGTNNKYWSSTENENEVTQAYTCSYSSKTLSSSGKKYNYYIRSWLVF